MKNQKKQHGKCKAQSYKIFLMELRQTYHLQRHFAGMSTILVKTETYHLDHREDIADLPQPYRTTGNWDRILVYNSDEFFISHHRTHSENWSVDGTFRVSSGIFFQVYTIHRQRDRRIFRCVLSLLPNKNGNAYLNI